MNDIKTTCEEMIEKYGANNVFMISRGYRSYVDDDYCTFTYWNNVTHEMFYDNWATAYACPSYSRFECMSLNEGIEKGLVDEKSYLDFLKKSSETMTKEWAEGTVRLWFLRLRQDYDVFVPARVSTGRKFRGECILVRRISVKSGDYMLDHGLVYDAVNNQLHEVVYNNVRVDVETIAESYREWVIAKMNACSTLKEWNERNDTFAAWLSERIQSMAFDLNGIPYEEKEERDLKAKFYEEKRKSFRERKMQELIEWAKKVKPHLTESERMSFVERVYERKYATA